MKVCVLYEFKEGPYGGANQFLKAIRHYFQQRNIYTDKGEEADIVLFNSSNATKETLDLKKKNPTAIFVQRLDGPTRVYNKKNDKRDLIGNMMNWCVADATIFQSEYSRRTNHEMGLHPSQYETTIINAPDETFFWRKKYDFDKKQKTKIIASSWSSNWNKGFDTYKYLDDNLDFTKYEMTFVGNTPVDFKNINVMPPMNSENLGDELRKNDIYITASRKESCSNSLLEAMSCGLPSIALCDGGNPEIIKDMGETFENNQEVPLLIRKMEQEYEDYFNKIKMLMHR